METRGYFQTGKGAIENLSGAGFSGGGHAKISPVEVFSLEVSNVLTKMISSQKPRVQRS